MVETFSNNMNPDLKMTAIKFKTFFYYSNYTNQ